MNEQDFINQQMMGFMPLLAALQAMKVPVSSAPTYTPQNLLDQFVIYKNGSTYRIYVWLDKASTWHYVALT